MSNVNFLYCDVSRNDTQEVLNDLIRIVQGSETPEIALPFGKHLDQLNEARRCLTLGGYQHHIEAHIIVRDGKMDYGYDIIVRRK